MEDIISSYATGVHATVVDSLYLQANQSQSVVIVLQAADENLTKRLPLQRKRQKTRLVTIRQR